MEWSLQTRQFQEWLQSQRQVHLRPLTCPAELSVCCSPWLCCHNGDGGGDGDDSVGDADRVIGDWNYQDIAQKNRAEEEVAHGTNGHYCLNFGIVIFNTNYRFCRKDMIDNFTNHGKKRYYWPVLSRYYWHYWLSKPFQAALLMASQLFKQALAGRPVRTSPDFV